MSAKVLRRHARKVGHYSPDKVAWAERAACRDHAPELWFPIWQEDAEPGKHICMTQCPVRQECLEHARANREHYGTWGGVDEWERARQRGRRKPL